MIVDELIKITILFLFFGLVGVVTYYVIDSIITVYKKIKKLVHNVKYKGCYTAYEPNTVKAYNISNGNRYSGDCAIRAITKLFGISWNLAFDKIAKYAKENGCITSTTWMILNFFRKHGYSYTKQDNKWYKPDLTFGDFAKTHPKGKYAIFSDDHVAAVIDGVIYDSWDSTHAKVVHIMEYVPGKKHKRNTWNIIDYTETNNN